MKGCPPIAGLSDDVSIILPSSFDHDLLVRGLDLVI